MTVDRPESGKFALQMNTAIEVAVVASPTILLVVGVVSWFSFPPPLLGWLSCGLLGLLATVWLSRTSAIGYRLVDWPAPETIETIAVSSIAYNSSLVLSTGIAYVTWELSTNVLLAVGIGTSLPAWILKHIRLIAFLSEE